MIVYCNSSIQRLKAIVDWCKRNQLPLINITKVLQSEQWKILYKTQQEAENCTQPNPEPIDQSIISYHSQFLYDRLLYSGLPFCSLIFLMISLNASSLIVFHRLNKKQRSARLFNNRNGKTTDTFLHQKMAIIMEIISLLFVVYQTMTREFFRLQYLGRKCWDTLWYFGITVLPYNGLIITAVGSNRVQTGICADRTLALKHPFEYRKRDKRKDAGKLLAKSLGFATAMVVLFVSPLGIETKPRILQTLQQNQNHPVPKDYRDEACLTAEQNAIFGYRFLDGLDDYRRIPLHLEFEGSCF